MNRRVLFVCLLAAMPGVLRAQEYKLVNCRTLEAAGNFVGSDEVLSGDMVCQRVKATAAEPVKVEPQKALPGAVISGSGPANVVEAAKVKAKKAEPAKDGGTAGSPDAAKPVSVPIAPRAEPATIVPKPVAPEEPSPAKAPGVATPPAAKPQIVLPVMQLPKPVTAGTEPLRQEPPSASQSALQAAAKSGSSVAATPAPVVRIHRDAPVAAGTPSAPPEKDYGFSDVNAVEAPAISPARETAATATGTGAGTRTDDQHGARGVQVGAFDKATPAAADGGSQAHNTNFLPGDMDGFQEGQRPECSKNITLGSFRDEKLVLGTPAWAQNWMEKNQKRFANICFSATPMRGARNYLIVFYMLAGNAQGQNNGNSAMPLPDATTAGGVSGFTTKYGSTWHYEIDRKVGATVATQDGADELSGAGQVWYVTAYTEDGMPVAERWPERGKDTPKNDNAERVSEELLGVMVEDLRKL